MFIKSLQAINGFIAGDKTEIKEIIHPDKDSLKIGYSMAHATVLPGKSSIPHQLKSSEVYFILQGKGNVFIDHESKIVEKGDLVFIPPMANQYIENVGDIDLNFICIVEPAWKIEDEIID